MLLVPRQDHASIVAGSARITQRPKRVPSQPKSTLTNEEGRINTQLRRGPPAGATTTNRMHCATSRRRSSIHHLNTDTT